MKKIISFLILSMSLSAFAQIEGIKGLTVEQLQKDSVLQLKRDLNIPQGTQYIYLNEKGVHYEETSTEEYRESGKAYCVLFRSSEREFSKRSLIKKDKKFILTKASSKLDFMIGGQISELSLQAEVENNSKFKLRCAVLGKDGHSRKLTIGRLAQVLGTHFQIKIPAIEVL